MQLGNIVKHIEKYIIKILMAMMAIVIVLATLELGWILITDLITPPLFLLEVDELLDIFGMFMLILIGVELLETIQTYSEEKTIRVEIVIAVAIIAIARKLIILDYNKLSTLTLWDAGAVILCLALSYYLLQRTHDKARSRKIKSMEATNQTGSSE
jgi:uncharacterized membrane protein (DUF373 family)